MLVQVGFERKRLAAPGTGVHLDGRVRLHVSSEVRPVGERLAAVGTAVRLLARVRPHVSLEEPRARERLVADGTAVSQVVCQYVHRQRGHADVDLVAVRALLRLLAVQTPVRLFVSGEVRRRGVLLAALGARVPVRRRAFRLGALPVLRSPVADVAAGGAAVARRRRRFASRDALVARASGLARLVGDVTRAAT